MMVLITTETMKRKIQQFPVWPGCPPLSPPKGGRTYPPPPLGGIEGGLFTKTEIAAQNYPYCNLDAGSATLCLFSEK